MTNPKPEEPYSAFELELAEALGCALAARARGVAADAVAEAFGAEAGGLATVAASLREGGLADDPGPSPAFLRRLQLEVTGAVAAQRGSRRPMQWRRLVTLPETALVMTLAATIAVGAFLLGAGGFITGDATAVPTVRAATTETATARTPEARATSPADQSDLRRLARTVALPPAAPRIRPAATPQGV